MRDILRRGFEALGIEAPETAYDRFQAYYETLTETNRVMNLTAITEKDEVARLHFLDSAAVLLWGDCAGKRVVDVGTGAGFPGLPLKILRPDTELILLDSLQKRVGFLSDTCERLGLDGVECIHGRAEETPKLRERCDLALSRAVARLNLLCELCLPLVKVGGAFLALKGPEPEAEMEEARNAVGQLGGKMEEPLFYTIPGTEVRHSIVIVRKLRETPKQFPRRFAKIQKSPL